MFYFHVSKFLIVHLIVVVEAIVFLLMFSSRDLITMFRYVLYYVIWIILYIVIFCWFSLISLGEEAHSLNRADSGSMTNLLQDIDREIQAPG